MNHVKTLFAVAASLALAPPLALADSSKNSRVQIDGSVGTLPPFASPPTFNLGTGGVQGTTPGTSCGSGCTIDMQGNPAGTPVPVGTSGKILPVVLTPNAGAYAGARMALDDIKTVAAFKSAAFPQGFLTNFSMWANAAPYSSAPFTVHIFAKALSGSSACAKGSAFVLAPADIPSEIPGSPFTVTLVPPADGESFYTASQNFSVGVSNLDSAATANLYVCILTTGAITPGVTTGTSFALGMIQ